MTAWHIVDALAFFLGGVYGLRPAIRHAYAAWHYLYRTKVAFGDTAHALAKMNALPARGGYRGPAVSRPPTRQQIPRVVARMPITLTAVRDSGPVTITDTSDYTPPEPPPVEVYRNCL